MGDTENADDNLYAAGEVTYKSLRFETAQGIARLTLDRPPARYPISFPEDGSLVDDEGHPRDLLAAVRQVFETVFDDRADAIWQEAYIAWRAHPAFGIGGDNFRHITVALLDQWERARGSRYDATAFIGTSHAHSLYLNTLAGRGLIGIALLALLLVAWLTSLLHHLPQTRDPPLYWLNWSGAASAFVASVGIGLFNTTLHATP